MGNSREKKKGSVQRHQHELSLRIRSRTWWHPSACPEGHGRSQPSLPLMVSQKFLLLQEKKKKTKANHSVQCMIGIRALRLRLVAHSNAIHEDGISRPRFSANRLPRTFNFRHRQRTIEYLTESTVSELTIEATSCTPLERVEKEEELPDGGRATLNSLSEGMAREARIRARIWYSTNFSVSNTTWSGTWSACVPTIKTSDLFRTSVACTEVRVPRKER